MEKFSLVDSTDLWPVYRCLIHTTLAVKRPEV